MNIKVAFKGLFTVAIAALLITNIGCKPQNPDGRENVSGKITLNGQPLGEKTGVFGIQFDPQGDDKTAGGHGQIQSGTYLLTGQDGVKPGKYTVRITGTATFDRTTKDYASPDTLMENEYQVVLVPREFNVDSTLEFEVVAKKKNVFNYDIVTDFAGEEEDRGKKHGGEI